MRDRRYTANQDTNKHPACFNRLLKNYVAAALRRHHTQKKMGFLRDKPAATPR
jgi:hypothetical protein